MQGQFWTSWNGCCVDSIWHLGVREGRSLGPVWLMGLATCHLPCLWTGPAPLIWSMGPDEFDTLMQEKQFVHQISVQKVKLESTGKLENISITNFAPSTLIIVIAVTLKSLARGEGRGREGGELLCVQLMAFSKDYFL